MPGKRGISTIDFLKARINSSNKDCILSTAIAAILIMFSIYSQLFSAVVSALHYNWANVSLTKVVFSLESPADRSEIVHSARSDPRSHHDIESQQALRSTAVLGANHLRSALVWHPGKSGVYRLQRQLDFLQQDDRLLVYVAYYLAEILLTPDVQSLWALDDLLDVIWLWVQGGAYEPAKRLINSLLTEHPGKYELYYYLAQVYSHQGNYQAATAILSRLIERDPERGAGYLQMGDIHYQKAQQYTEVNQRNQSLEDAASWYHQYYELSPQNPFGLKRLSDVYRELGKSDEFKDWQRRLENHLGNRQPEYKVGQQVGDSWILVGYDLDEKAVERGGKIPIWLYWLPRKTLGFNGSDLYRVGELLVQLKYVENLAPKGAFESERRTGSRLPHGYQSVYSASLEHYEVVVDTRYGDTTGVVRLSNKTDDSSGLASYKIPIQPSGFYLLAGWIRANQGGNGFLGCNWLEPVRDQPPTYRYVIGSASPKSWTYFAGVVKPLPGSEDCTLWLLNFQSNGEVYFDDILFFELQPPTEN